MGEGGITLQSFLMPANARERQQVIFFLFSLISHANLAYRNSQFSQVTYFYYKQTFDSNNCWQLLTKESVVELINCSVGALVCLRRPAVLEVWCDIGRHHLTGRSITMTCGVRRLLSLLLGLGIL